MWREQYGVSNREAFQNPIAHVKQQYPVYIVPLSFTFTLFISVFVIIYSNDWIDKIQNKTRVCLQTNNE